LVGELAFSPDGELSRRSGHHTEDELSSDSSEVVRNYEITDARPQFTRLTGFRRAKLAVDAGDLRTHPVQKPRGVCLLRRPVTDVLEGEPISPVKVHAIGGRGTIRGRTIRICSCVRRMRRLESEDDLIDEHKVEKQSSPQSF